VGQIPDLPDLPSYEAKDQLDELMFAGAVATGRGLNVTVTQALADS
jgi:hypothetical protein